MVCETLNRLKGGKFLFVICVLVTSGIIVAGLWPFHPPKNEVTWLGNKDGLLFGDYGSILSSGEFKVSQNGPSSLEIWLQPAATFDSNDILAFSTPQNPIRFAVAQSGDDLFVVRGGSEAQHVKAAYIAIDHVFRKGKVLLIVITSGLDGTRVYLNGVLVRTSQQFTFTGKELTGELVIGNSPVQNNSWGGQLWRLAIFDRELTPSQVLQHYDARASHEATAITEWEGTRALFLFDERAGRVVHNHVNSEPDLYIPERFFVLHPKFLEPLWREFEPNWIFGENVILNIVAFIPLGFFLCACLSHQGRLKRPELFSVILGFAVSLTIEILQAYLPTRDSGTTDIVTNTLGTAAGALFYRKIAARHMSGKRQS